MKYTYIVHNYKEIVTINKWFEGTKKIITAIMVTEHKLKKV